MASPDPIPEDPLHSLKGRVVLVTGSSSGIGAAIARAFAGQGARVVINSSSSPEAGRSVAGELGDAFYHQANVADEGEATRLIEATLDRWGQLDHLINNAGTTSVIPHRELEAASDEIWRRILDVNLMGTWYISRAAVPALRRSRGSILNITSLAGVQPTGSSIPYAVSKAAVNHLARLLAAALGPEIRVNALAPGLIATPWTADWAAAHQRVAENAPLARSGTPEDIARAALLLTCSPYTTGEVLLADGGLHLR